MVQTTIVDGPLRRGQIISIRDACAHLSIGRTSLYKAFADGQIRPVKFGKRTLVPRDELERFAASLTNT